MSIDAAGEYIKKMGGNGIPLIDQQKMLNYVAHGFYMGFRKVEEEFGWTDEN